MKQRRNNERHDIFLLSSFSSFVSSDVFVIENIKKMQTVAWMRILRNITFLSLFFSSCLLLAEDVRSDVVILANANISESQELARYYAEKRNIPEENIMFLPMPKEESISRDSFITDILNPIRAIAFERQWLKGEKLEGFDDLGRQKYNISDATVRYLIICKGVPLRILHDPTKVTSTAKNAPQNNGAVDSELALLAIDGYRITNPLPNPFFQKTSDFVGAKPILIVGRVDAPDFKTAHKMIDDVLEVEKHGLRGRAYIDTGGPYPVGDEWISACGNMLLTEGFDLDWNREKALFPNTARFDTPALYFGWYERSPRGIIAENGITFATGAIAYHLHSFSATTLKNPQTDWVPFFLSRGAAASAGNVFEPYLQLIIRPDILLKNLLKGETIGEASLVATTAFRWQNTLIGDPLYRPFKVSLEEQIENLGQNAELDSYVVLRQMNLLTLEGKYNEAVAWGRQQYLKVPSLALAYRLGSEMQKQNKIALAKQFFSVARTKTNISPSERTLLKQIADACIEIDDPKTGLDIYQNLLKQADMPIDVRKWILNDGIKQAQSIKADALSQAWTNDLEKIIAAEQKKKEK